MTTLFTRLLVATALVAASTGPAAAAVTFDVTGTLTDFFSAPAGNLSGTFTTNDALTAVTSFNLTASASGAFTGFTFNNANSAVTAAVLPSQFVQFDSSTFGYELRLFFANGLTAQGGTILSAASYEFEPAGGIRSVDGAVTAASTGAVPEPASWAMIILGMGAIGYALRRRVLASEVRFDAKIRRISEGAAA